MLGEADNKGIDPAQMTELHRAAEAVVANISGSGIVQIGHACAVDGVAALGHSPFAEVVVVYDWWPDAGC